MSREPLMRVDAPPKRRRPSHKPWMLWIPVGVIALGLTGAAGGYLIAGPDRVGDLLRPAAQTTSQSKPAETQVECANIKHAYTQWQPSAARLRGLHEQNRTVAQMEAKRLMDDAKLFFDAVSGYKDDASKKLAVDVGQYRVDVGFATLAPTMGQPVDRELQLKAQDSLRKADGSYSMFLALTCS